MCYLIHIGVPQSRADEVPRSRLPRIARQENPSIAEAFGRGFVLFSVTDGGCACKLFSPPSAPDPWRDSPERKKRQYGRLGWSQAKIDRALATFEQDRSTSNRGAGLRQEVAAFIGELAVAFGEVKLLVHEYRGLFGTEKVIPRGSRSLRAEEFEGPAYCAVSEDVIYIVHASTAG